VLVAPAQTDVCAAFVFPRHEPRLLKNGVRQLSVQGMVVLVGGHTHRRESAVEQEPAVGLQIVARRPRLVEHRLHGDVSAAEGCRPDLLPLKGQHDQLAHTVFELDGRDTAVIQEQRCPERAALKKRSLLLREETRIQRNLC